MVLEETVVKGGFAMSKKREKLPLSGVLYAGHIPPGFGVKIGDSLYTSDGKGLDKAAIRTRVSSGRKPVLSQKKRKLENLKDRVLDKWRVGK